jgi:anaerobic selenocysteine-containing dehydrogenase
LVRSRSLEEWARVADVGEHEIVSLAISFAEGPSSILVGWGMQRRQHGSATIRTIDALGAISGNLGITDGGVSFYFNRRSTFDVSFVRGLDVAPRSIPEPLLGPGILSATDPPIRMVWVTAGNPVAMLPQSKEVARALESREFIVVVDSFLTDTARCAQLVLPTTTMLEEDDLLGAYGHHWLIESRPVVPRPDGVRSDFEIVQELAGRVGLNGEFALGVDDWKRRLLNRVESDGASLEDLRRGAVRNPRSKKLVFAERTFATPTGRVNLVRDVTVDPPQPTADRPLPLMASSSERSQASQWVHGSPEGPLTATVHPGAAEGFIDGGEAIVQSELGEMTVKLQFDSRQRKDVLLISKGGWLSRGQCGNALVPARVTDAGGCAVYHDTPVRLVVPQ